jgi:hypothetical protein
MSKEIGAKEEEHRLIQEISSFGGNIISPGAIKDYLEDAISFLRSKNKDIKLTVGFLKMYMLQSITRDEGKREKATILTEELLRCVGEYEANYFSNFINNLESNLQKQGRSFFSKTPKEEPFTLNVRDD